MSKFYSKKNNGFYDDNIHTSLPDDAVPIDDDAYIALFGLLNNNHVLSCGENGKPMAIEVKPDVAEWRKTATISAAKARLNLAALGKLQAVLDFMSELPDIEPIKIQWEYETELHRNSVLLVDFCQDRLGLSSEEIDLIFQVQ